MNYLHFARLLVSPVLPLLFTHDGAARDAAVTESPIRIYISNDDHTDYMWTADAETYNRVFVEMLDFHLDLTEQTLGNPTPYQNRFNADGNFWLYTYERQKDAAAFSHLIERVRSGHISVPLNALVSCYGGQPLEAALRGMYYAGRLERRFNLRFTQAVAMENQTLPLGLASLWSGAGAEFSWKGVCACASRMPTLAGSPRDHEIYWYTGLDGSRVLMKWHSIMSRNNRESGGYAEAFDPVGAIAFLSSDEGFLSRYRPKPRGRPYVVRAAFGFGWDALDRKTGQPYLKNPQQYPEVPHFHEVAQAHSNATRQVFVSNQEDFFHDFRSTHGAELPAQAVTHGNEWDLYSASLSEVSARVRRAVETLRTAEALSTLVSLERPEFRQDKLTARDDAFMALGLFWEHNWTADGPIRRADRAAWQEQRAAEIETYTADLLKESAGELGRLIPREGNDPQFFVFNPLSWERTDVADVPYEGPETIRVQDLATGADVPHQFMQRNGVRTLRFLARQVPSVGYKVFAVRPAAASAGNPSEEPAATFAGGVLENAWIRLALEKDGAIASLIDKRDPTHDLAATIDGLKLNDLAAHEGGGESLVVENAGPVSVTILAKTGAARDHQTRITLYRDSDRVDLQNEILENFGDVRHWSFSVNVSKPLVHTEELGAIIRVKTKAEGGDYADRLARYDYATLNHFADISDEDHGRGLTLSNADAAFVRLGRSTPDRLDTATPQLNVLAGGQVDGDTLGIRNQNGARYFLHRFALRPHRGFDAASAMRFALEHQNPFHVGVVGGDLPSSLPAPSFSLLTVDDPRVMVWAVKPAEEGIQAGTITRYWSLANEPLETRITLSHPLVRAERTTHLETTLGPIPSSAEKSLLLRFERQQLQTLRLLLGPGEKPR